MTFKFTPVVFVSDSRDVRVLLSLVDLSIMILQLVLLSHHVIKCQSDYAFPRITRGDEGDFFLGTVLYWSENMNYLEVQEGSVM